eukprot:3055732-Lingulodinium_polyedra.AAC.1
MEEYRQLPPNAKRQRLAVWRDRQDDRVRALSCLGSRVSLRSACAFRFVAFRIAARFAFRTAVSIDVAIIITQ